MQPPESTPEIRAEGRPVPARTAPPRPLQAALSTWLERHAQTMVGSVGRLLRQPFATVLTVAVIGIALALPTCLHLIIANGRSLTTGLEDTVQISVYLRQPMTAEDARKLALTIDARDDVAGARLVTPEEGLREFESLSGFGEALKALQDNPLPYAVVVRPAQYFDTPEAVETLTADLRTMPQIELVQVDTEWVRRLQAILAALRRVVEITAGLLGLGVLAVVGNTIRLDINGRREEIEVTKLVGGDDSFVRRPFLYSGLWYGLLGGIFAAGIAAAATSAMEAPVAQLAALYGSTFRLAGIDSDTVLALIGGGALLGWLGSWVSAAYHLRRIEPRA
ncbi:MAG: ABC transporter permease [Gammaproteobacteria bacterium]|nr:ABC transporter permease [Gammaproteobacteria bacterium]